jgi:hypothetical protein
LLLAVVHCSARLFTGKESAGQTKAGADRSVKATGRNFNEETFVKANRPRPTLSHMKFSFASFAMLTAVSFSYAQNTFQENGNVGIGITTPVEALVVTGNIKSNQSFLLNNLESTTSFKFFIKRQVPKRFGWSLRQREAAFQSNNNFKVIIPGIYHLT